MIHRRHLLSLLAAGAVAPWLSACGRKTATDPLPDGLSEEGADGEPVEKIDPKLAQQEGTLEWAISGSWRSAIDKARDKYRHPIELMTFFEVDKGDTIIDMWPGAGYMTEVLAPYLNKGKGQYIAAVFQTPLDDKTSAQGQLNARFEGHFNADKKIYGQPRYVGFGTESPPLGDAASVDGVLMLLVIQDWMATGIAEKAFSDAFSVLKPGGILGVEQHRADIGTSQDPVATGYVQEPFVKQLAQEAGFQFVSSSEINSNPKDDKEHPFGVWTLPPQRATAPRGQSPNPEFDSTLYESIGESDRMVLKFRKPQ